MGQGRRIRFCEFAASLATIAFNKFNTIYRRSVPRGDISTLRLYPSKEYIRRVYLSKEID